MPPPLLAVLYLRSKQPPCQSLRRRFERGLEVFQNPNDKKMNSSLSLDLKPLRIMHVYEVCVGGVGGHFHVF